MKTIVTMLLYLSITIQAYSQDTRRMLYAGEAVEFRPLVYSYGISSVPLLQTNIGYIQKLSPRWALTAELAGMRGYYSKKWSNKIQDQLNLNVNYKGGGIFAGLNYTLINGKGANLYTGFNLGLSFLSYNTRLTGNISGWGYTSSGKHWNFSAAPVLGFNVNIAHSGFIRVEAAFGLAGEDSRYYFVSGNTMTFPPSVNAQTYYLSFRPQFALGFRF